MNNPNKTEWNNEQCAELERLLATGMIHKDIATALNERFGTSISKKAVSNKVCSLRLQGPAEKKWSEEQNAELARLAETGISYRDVAEAINAKFGTRFTRNAITGRINRLRLGKPAQPRAPRDPGTKRIRIRKKVDRRDQGPAEQRATMRIVGSGSNTRLIQSVRTDFVPRCVEVVPLNLRLVDKDETQCCFIAGDDHLYCGHPKLVGSSFCPAHHDLCWVKSTPKAVKYYAREMS